MQWLVKLASWLLKNAPTIASVISGIASAILAVLGGVQQAQMAADPGLRSAENLGTNTWVWIGSTICALLFGVLMIPQVRQSIQTLSDRLLGKVNDPKARGFLHYTFCTGLKSMHIGAPVPLKLIADLEAYEAQRNVPEPAPAPAPAALPTPAAK